MKKLVISTVAAAALIAVPFTGGKADAAELHPVQTKVVTYQYNLSDNADWCKQILAKFNWNWVEQKEQAKSNTKKPATEEAEKTPAQSVKKPAQQTEKSTTQPTKKPVQQTEKAPTQSQQQQQTVTKNPNQQPAQTENTSNKQVTSQLSAYEQQVVDLTNQERAKNGLSPLKVDLELSRVAKEKSKDMSTNNYFSHTSPVYGSPFDMMKSYGISYRSAGENIAMGQRTPQEVVNAWMNSSGHRANILNSSFTHIGVGYVENGNYWTQQFIGK